jgi:hypothetical protein
MHDAMRRVMSPEARVLYSHPHNHSNYDYSQAIPSRLSSYDWIYPARFRMKWIQSRDCCPSVS